MNFELLGIHLQLITNQKEFTEYLRFFSCLQMEENTNSDPDICVQFYFNKPFKKINDYKKIARNIWIGNNRIFISEIERCPGLKLEVITKNNKLIIDAYFFDKTRNIMKRVIPYFRVNKRKREFQFIALIFYLIYYPFFYYLERFSNFCILHAAAFEYNEKGVLLPGLGGIGKSTFSLGSLVSNRNRLISDNIIFCHSKKIYRFPELIALDLKSIRILKLIEDLLIPKKSIIFSHNRTYYQLNSEFISNESIPKYLFWLHLGNENKVLSLDKESCVRHLLNINLLAKELREYYLLAAAFDLAFSHSFSPTTYSNNLSDLLSNVDCYVLQFKPGDDIKTIFDETIARIIV